MANVILYIASSLDGMIARTDGNLDWLENLPNDENTDYGYAEMLQSCGTIIMGKNTYNQLLSFGIDWPYPNHKTYVATNDKQFYPTSPETFQLENNIDCFVQELKSSDKNIWLVGGGKLINYFLLNNLIDKIIICIAPVILGSGIPMFSDISIESEWELEDVEKFKNGIVSLTYSKK